MEAEGGAVAEGGEEMGGCADSAAYGIWEADNAAAQASMRALRAAYEQRSVPQTMASLSGWRAA